jgi:hypothetical protein
MLTYIYIYVYIHIYLYIYTRIYMKIHCRAYIFQAEPSDLYPKLSSYVSSLMLIEFDICIYIDICIYKHDLCIYIYICLYVYVHGAK